MRLAPIAAVMVLTSGCMSYVFQHERRQPSKDATLASVIGLGLVGDAIVALGASALHAQATTRSDDSTRSLVPYYGGALVGVDALVLAAMLSAK